MLTGYEVVLLAGSTGKHAAQISNGLRVDVFMAADVARPLLLEEKGLAIKGSRFTYAKGRLALWWPSETKVNEESLRNKAAGHLAIANPKLAPYGMAAVQTLKALDVYKHWRTYLVRGENIAQTYQFVHTGNADAGLVALSQIKGRPEKIWLIPEELHSPIKQQAVLLSSKQAAIKFHAFLRSEKALELIRDHGYDTP